MYLTKTYKNKFHNVLYMVSAFVGIFLFISTGYSNEEFVAKIAVTEISDSDDKLIAEDTEPPLIPTYNKNDDGSAQGVVIDMPDDDAIRSNLSNIFTQLSENYSFHYDQFTRGEDRSTNWYIEVKDKFSDASGTVKFKDMAGNETVEAFRYNAPKFRISKTNYSFGEVVTGKRPFTEFTITNESDEDKVTLNRLELKHKNRGFKIDTIDSVGYIILPKIFDPKESLKFRVYFNATEEGFFIDSIGIGTSWIFAYMTQISAKVVSPIIRADNIDFYDITIGDTIEKQVSVRNDGKVDLVLKYYSATSFPFSTNLPQITNKNNYNMKPGDRLNFTVRFTPDSLKIYSDSIVFSSNATVVDSVTYINGHGVKPGLIVSSFDWGRKRIDRPDRPDLLPVPPYVSAEYAVSLYNTEKDTIEIYDIDIEDVSKGYAFEFDRSKFKNMKLGSKQAKYVEVAFHPTEVGEHEIVFNYNNSLGSEAKSVFKGIGVVPKVTTQNVDFDTSLVNDVFSPVNRRIIFKNEDWEFADMMYIDTLIFLPNGDEVVVDTSDEAKPWGSEGFKIFYVNKNIPTILQAGETLELEVNFVAQKEGPAYTGIKIVTDALADTIAHLTGMGIFRGIKAYSENAAACVNDTAIIIYVIENYGWDSINVDSLRVVGSNSFQFLNPEYMNGFNIFGQAEKSFDIEFAPTEVETIEDAYIYAYHSEGDNVTEVKTALTGQSFFTQRGLTTDIHNNDYIIDLGDTLNVYVYLDQGDDISMYNIGDLFVRIEYNSNFLNIVKDNIQIGDILKTSGFGKLLKEDINIDKENGVITFPLTAGYNGKLKDDGELLKLEFGTKMPDHPDSNYQSSIISYFSTVGNHCVEFFHSNTLTIYLNKYLVDSTLQWIEFPGRKNVMLDVYPNPVLDNKADVIFEIKQEGDYEIKIFNSIGQIVETILSKEHLLSGKYQATIPVNSLIPGFYWCTMSNPGFTLSKKFVVIK
ncbi:choice-of-anchor D domain-containing protein [Bacteroidota bacterium]